MMPSGTPAATHAQVWARVAAAGHVLDRTKYPVVIIGVRGYYRDSMGVRGANDRGIYDDAIFVDTAHVFAAFNGNTDPSVVRPKTGRRKGMAVLRAGLWLAHRLGFHKGYRALSQQMGAVIVDRDGDPKPDKGYHGINIHRGALRTTSSEGCQTIPPAQWDAFITLVVSEGKRAFGTAWQQRTIPYILLDGM